MIINAEGLQKNLNLLRIVVEDDDILKTAVNIVMTYSPKQIHIIPRIIGI